VTLDGASKTLTDRSTGYIDNLTNREDFHGQLVASLQFSQLFSRNLEFNQTKTSLDTRLSEVTGFRLVHTIGLLYAKRNLDSCVAIGFRRLDLRDAVCGHVQHRYRDGCTIFGKDAGHADFATDKT